MSEKLDGVRKKRVGEVENVALSIHFPKHHTSIERKKRDTDRDGG